MIVRVGLLIGGTLLFWLLTGGVATLLGGGGQVWLTSAAAMGICLVPAIVTLALAEHFARNKPETVGLAFLAGTLVRMGVVLAAALILGRNVEFFRRQETWLTWVVVFYLVVLALETALVVVRRASPPAA